MNMQKRSEIKGFYAERTVWGLKCLGNLFESR